MASATGSFSALPSLEPCLSDCPPMYSMTM